MSSIVCLAYHMQQQLYVMHFLGTFTELGRLLAVTHHMNMTYTCFQLRLVTEHFSETALGSLFFTFFTFKKVIAPKIGGDDLYFTHTLSVSRMFLSLIFSSIHLLSFLLLCRSLLCCSSLFHSPWCVHIQMAVPGQVFACGA